MIRILMLTLLLAACDTGEPTQSEGNSTAWLKWGLVSSDCPQGVIGFANMGNECRQVTLPQLGTWKETFGQCFSTASALCYREETYTYSVTATEMKGSVSVQQKGCDTVLTINCSQQYTLLPCEP